MKGTILTLNLTLVCAIAAHAQKAETRASGEASSQTSAAMKRADRSINLESGTHSPASFRTLPMSEKPGLRSSDIENHSGN